VSVTANRPRRRNSRQIRRRLLIDVYQLPVQIDLGASAMTDRKSLSAYIAWLSTCLLAAAAGHLIDDITRTTWLVLGTFGLVAAVGLQVASRSFVARYNEMQQRASQRRMDRQLEHEGVNASEHGDDSIAKSGRPVAIGRYRGSATKEMN
jgi:hypothetical protein